MNNENLKVRIAIDRQLNFLNNVVSTVSGNKLFEKVVCLVCYLKWWLFRTLKWWLFRMLNVEFFDAVEHIHL